VRDLAQAVKRGEGTERLILSKKNYVMLYVVGLRNLHDVSMATTGYTLYRDKQGRPLSSLLRG
jgi:hypothetical protein